MAKDKKDKSTTKDADGAKAKTAKAKTAKVKTAKSAKTTQGTKPVTGERRTAPRPVVTTPGPPPPATEGSAAAPGRSATEKVTSGPRTNGATATTAARASLPVGASPGTGVGASLGTSAGTSPRAATAPSASTPASGHDARSLTDDLVRAALVPVDVARRVLPERRLPFYLGVGALGLVGLVEWPVALAAGLTWEALRRRPAR